MSVRVAYISGSPLLPMHREALNKLLGDTFIDEWAPPPTTEVTSYKTIEFMVHELMAKTGVYSHTRAVVVDVLDPLLLYSIIHYCEKVCDIRVFVPHVKTVSKIVLDEKRGGTVNMNYRHFSGFREVDFS
jgi:hypothetical protein